MNNILIMNLARMGDLVQTTPVLRGFKEKYPEVEITLLVNSVFAEICDFIPYFDKIIILELDKILSEIKKGDIIECYSYIRHLLDQINAVNYDLAINFAHTPPSAVLMSLINAREKRGITIDREGYSIKLHPWIRYFFNLLPGRNYNPFNLCDIYLLAAGVIPLDKGLHLSVSEESNKWAQSIFFANNINSDDLVIGFQLGASSEDKRWPVSSFARLGEHLIKHLKAKIVLTGSAKETQYGEEFEELCEHKVLNLIGRTDLRKLVAVLDKCKLVVSNDTGPLHIATAVGTTALDISLASVYFGETGPYGDGHYVIQSDLPCSPCTFGRACTEAICKDTISPDIVFEVVKKVLSNEASAPVSDSPFWDKVQLYTSFFDEDGLINYRPLIKRPLKKKELFVSIYRQTWPMILSKKAVDSSALAANIIERLSDWYIVDGHQLSKMVQKELVALESIRNYAYTALVKIGLISEEAGKPDPDIAWIKDTWKIVPDLDREIETAGSTCSPLKPLTSLFKYGRESLPENDLKSMASSAMVLYEDLIKHASVISEILKALPKLSGDSQTQSAATSAGKGSGLSEGRITMTN